MASKKKPQSPAAAIDGDEDIEDLVGTPKAGHNVEKVDPSPASANAAAGQLRSFIERIERLEEDKRAVAEDIKEVYAEAKGTGFDAKTIRKVIAVRRKPKEEVDEEQALLDLYLSALGMLT